jgi:hypothetical protein
MNPLKVKSLEQFHMVSSDQVLAQFNKVWLAQIFQISLVNSKKFTFQVKRPTRGTLLASSSLFNQHHLIWNCNSSNFNI